MTLNLLKSNFIHSKNFALGNIIYGDTSREKQWEQFNILDIFSFFLASYVGIGFLIFLQPVVQLWMGKDYLLSDEFVWLFSMTIYFIVVWEIIYKYRNVFGDYIQDRNLMVLSAIINILVSIPGGYFLGTVGIQLGTLIAFFPIAYGRIRFVVKGYFKKSILQYLMKHVFLCILVITEGGICWYTARNVPIDMKGLLQRFCIWLIIPLIINFIIFFHDTYFKEMMRHLRTILG